MPPGRHPSPLLSILKALLWSGDPEGSKLDLQLPPPLVAAMENPNHDDINDSALSDEECPPSTIRRCGLGQGGNTAKYCGQMTPQTRLSTMASSSTNVEMFDVRMTDSGEEKNWCLCCGKPVSHEALTFMKSHIQTHTRSILTLGRSVDRNKRRLLPKTSPSCRKILKDPPRCFVFSVASSLNCSML